jgi:hypothetical protein
MENFPKKVRETWELSTGKVLNNRFP